MMRPEPPVCLIVQPIHPVGLELLRVAGLSPRVASAADMDTIRKEIRDATAVITRSAGLTAAAMAAAPTLRVVGSHGVGVNAIDVSHATALGIAVVNTPEANRDSVAEHTIALMLAAARSVVTADAAARRGDFDFKYRATLSDLAGKVLGIIGFGGIGRRVGVIARAGFNMNVLVASRSADPDLIRSLGFKPAESLESLLSQADIVTLHLPLLPGARPLINARELRLMKPSSILINTARGALVDELSLCQALSDGTISAAALDVFASEPITADSPLLRLPNVVLSPHVGGSSREALERTARQLVERIVAVLNGTPMDLVNPEMWPRRR
jgi:D-3-phosphoglycerate dehydrogenase / 2-oxoglutarate reductase